MAEIVHYFQFNIGDYAKRTRHLSDIEDLAYRRLLDLYYTTEIPFFDDVENLSRLIGLRKNENEVKNVLKDFFLLKKNKWHNKRVDEEIMMFRSKADTARANGKKGGRPKKTQPVKNRKAKITQLVPVANPVETGLKANQEPTTNNQEPVNDLVVFNKSDEIEKNFNRFYNSGLVKKSKVGAFKAFNKVMKEIDFNLWEHFTNQLCENIKYRVLTQEQGFDALHPSTYLNQERWMDESTGALNNEKSKRHNQNATTRAIEDSARLEREEQDAIDKKDAPPF